MRKFIAVLLVFALGLLGSAALADDLGVQMIGGPETESEPISLDDMKVGTDYEIEGYAKVTPQSFEFVDMFAQWADGQASAATDRYYKDTRYVFCENPSDGDWHSFFQNCSFQESGNDAEFAWLKVDVMNLKKSDVSYLGEASVKVVYDDEYEFSGWIRQFNYDYSMNEIFRYDSQTAIGWPVCLSNADEMPVGMMYTGHFVFGCTLPNSVVNGKEPLRMVINLGENELTYNIRK